MKRSNCRASRNQTPTGRSLVALATLMVVALMSPALAAQERPPESPPAEAAAGLSGLERLYVDLAEAVADFEAGLELVRSDYDWLGEEKMASAAERLREIAGVCATITGCDIRRVLDAYSGLLEHQGDALAARGLRLDSLEAEIAGSREAEEGTIPFLGKMPELDRSLSLLQGTDLRELIRLNGPVNAALDDWLTWMRPDLIDAWFNYQFLRSRMAPVYQQAGLPEALLFAMVATESRGKVHAVSRAGAAGPLQFARGTGKRYGLDEIDGFDLRFDPEAATRANVAYLEEHLRLFNNDLEKVLAAYNGGENRMKGVQRRHGNASFWDSKVYYSFPRETRDYVPRVLAAAWLFLHPEDYNLVFPQPATAAETLEVQRETSLSELAICLGQEGNLDGWFRTLRNLNPRLEPSDRIAEGSTIQIPASLVSVYRDSCLEGELLTRARTLHEANYPEEPPLISYTVRSGDTLNQIAQRHRCASIREIAEINRIRAPRYVIRVGQRLLVPTCR